MSYIGHYDEEKTFPEKLVESFNIVNGDDGPYVLGKMIPGGYAANVEVYYSIYDQTDGEQGPYTMLKPQDDYSIGGSESNLYKELTFTNADLPLFYDTDHGDKFFVIHSGTATYQLVPAPQSVTADSLATNLRTFAVDPFTGDNSTTEFELSKSAATFSSILVFIDGTFMCGDPNNSPTVPNEDYYITSSPYADNTTLKFRVAPGTGAEIKVIHLSFSTVSNYSTLTTGLATGSVNSDHLAALSVIESKIGTGAVTENKIGSGAVTENKIGSEAVTSGKLGSGAVTAGKIGAGAIATADIANDAVDSTKIRLANDTSLNANIENGTETPIVKVDASDVVHFGGCDAGIAKVALDVSGSPIVNVTATTVEPETDGTVDVGTSAKRFANVYSAAADVSGNITVGGTVDGVDVSSMATYIPSNTPLAELLPAGTIVDYAGSSAPTGWLICNGASLSRSGTYAKLFGVIGTAFGSVDASTFNIPDLRRRVSIGKHDETLGSTEGVSDVKDRSANLSHTHAYSHTHTVNCKGPLTGHTHGVSIIIPSGTFSHTHNMSSHTHDMDHAHLVYGHSHYINALNTATEGAHYHGFPGRGGATTINGTPESPGRFGRGDSGSTQYDTGYYSYAGTAHLHLIPAHWTKGNGTKKNDVGEHQATTQAIEKYVVGNTTTTPFGMPYKTFYTDAERTSYCVIKTNTGVPSANNTGASSMSQTSVTSSSGSTGTSSPAEQSMSGTAFAPNITNTDSNSIIPHIYLNKIIKY
jgi:microcystin-dependent protein